MSTSGIPSHRVVRVVVERQGTVDQGTGFRFSSNRVVTAFHVVEGAEIVRVLDPDGDDWRDSGPLRPETGHGVVRPSTEEANPTLDAAVLATPELAGIDRASFTDNPWSARHRWETCGFPVNEPSTRKGFYGEAFPPNAGFCELTVRDSYVEAIEEGWGGLSGAPVFLNIQGAGWVFAGVIVDGPEDAKGHRLWAVTLPALLAERSFRIALLGDEPDWFEAYVALIQEVLEGDGHATSAIRMIFGLDPNLPASKELAQKVVFDLETQGVCMALAKAAKNLDQNGRRESGDRVRSVLAALAPIRFLRSRGMIPPDSKSRRIDLEVATDLGADAVVAAMQCRLMEVEIVPGDIPSSRFSVAQPGVFGLDIDGVDASHDVVEDLRRLIELAPVGPAHTARAYTIHLANDLKLLPESLKRRIAELETTDETWEKAAARAVNRRLEALADSEKFYLLIALKADSNRREQFLQYLGKDLPALLQVTRTSNDSEQFDREDQQLQSPFQTAFSGDPDDHEETK